jgi:hypothetical protein
VIDDGSAILVDVFASDSNIYVVRVDALRSFDLYGNLAQEMEWPRDILSAAFDGERLVIADAARFTTLDRNLSELASADAVEPCASAVLVGGPRLVCGPDNDWDRIFYTYDALTGELLATSSPYTYNGIPMRRVPGTDAFVTVPLNLSPPDFSLYEVAPSGEAIYVGESPYHGEFDANDVYAFDGVPPVHLITHEGLMLEIEGADPFVKDGAVGTLSTGEYFLGLDNDGSGKLYGLMYPGLGDYWPGESLCERGCVVQRIDIASNTVDDETSHNLDLGALVAARHHSGTDTLVVGYRRSGDYHVPSGDPYPGYRVERLPY